MLCPYNKYIYCEWMRNEWTNDRKYFTFSFIYFNIEKEFEKMRNNKQKYHRFDYHYLSIFHSTEWKYWVKSPQIIRYKMENKQGKFDDFCVVTHDSMIFYCPIVHLLNFHDIFHHKKYRENEIDNNLFCLVRQIFSE